MLKDQVYMSEKSVGKTLIIFAENRNSRIIVTHLHLMYRVQQIINSAYNTDVKWLKEEAWLALLHSNRAWLY